MSLQERYNRLSESQKKEFLRMQKPSMLTNWKQLTDRQIIEKLERTTNPSKFNNIASRPKVLGKSEPFDSVWFDMLHKKKKSKTKKDACYHKVRGRYKKWPSAYASGALVQCRKVGAKNWGNSKKK